MTKTVLHSTNSGIPTESNAQNQHRDNSTFTHTYVHIYIYIYMHIYICIYTYKYVCMCIYIYIHIMYMHACTLQFYRIPKAILNPYLPQSPRPVENSQSHFPVAAPLSTVNSCGERGFGSLHPAHPGEPCPPLDEHTSPSNGLGPSWIQSRCEWSKAGFWLLRDIDTMSSRLRGNKFEVL